VLTRPLPTGHDTTKIRITLMTKALALIAMLAAATGAWLFPATVQAGADLQTVKARNMLRCGVNEDIPGFAARDAAGNWQGFNVDFCRAVAAAAIGDPDKVEFIPLTAAKRFPALQSKKIDLLMRNTTRTLSRETLLKVQFPAVLFYDGQGFMVAKSARIRSVDKLKGSTICIAKGTTHEKRLLEFFARRNESVTPLVIDSAGAAAEALYSGRCQAYTSDASQLAALRTRAPGGAKAFDILPERISREPTGPVVRNGDTQWATLVGWVLHVLVIAEEYGITRDNLDTRSADLSSNSLSWRLVSGGDEWLAREMGARKDWGARAIRAVGNYGEMFERHLGKNTPLALERGANRLWTEGGLMYAPPID
jgi:general L-amino acid transport system substrate-binding protein